MASEVSLEETNRLRRSLGLKPIPVPVEAEAPVRAAERAKPKSSTQTKVDGNSPKHDSGGIAESLPDETSANWLKSFQQLRKKQLDADSELEVTTKDLDAEPSQTGVSEVLPSHVLDPVKHTSLQYDAVLTLKDSNLGEEDQIEIQGDHNGNNSSLGNSKGSSSDSTTTAASAHSGDLDWLQQKSPSNEEDYESAPKPIKFKKINKKRKEKGKGSHRKRSWQETELSDETNAAEMDESALESVLAKRRIKHLKVSAAAASITPEAVVETLASTPTLSDEQRVDTDGELVIDDTKEFLQRLSSKRLDKDVSTAVTQKDSELPGIKVTPGVGRLVTDMSDAKVDPKPLQSARLTDEDEGLTVGGGLADTMKLLQNKGVIRKVSDDERERITSQQRKHQQNQDIKHRMMKRKAEFYEELKDIMASSVYKGMTEAEKKQVQDNHDAKWSEILAQESRIAYANYTPEIKYEHRDSHGRILSSKEAFRELSHTFHGTAVGKGRAEKELQKREEEKRKESASIFGGAASSVGTAGNGMRLQ